MPGLSLGDVVPDVEGDTTQGRMKLHDYIGNSWTIVFSHPADFTPVCTTEMGEMAKYAPEFKKRGVKLLGLSGDDVQSHKSWISDVEAFSGGGCVDFPVMGDPEQKILRELNMIDPDEKDPQGKPRASRALHIIGPDKRLKLSFLYPGTTGRNIDEVIRVLDSLQLAEKHQRKIATPVNWRKGDKVVVAPSVSDEEARKMFSEGLDVPNLPSGKPYLRFAKVS